MKDRRDNAEHFTKLFRLMMEEPAWRALPCPAQALYPWLKLQWRGPKSNNNGKIQLSVRQAAHALNVSPNTAAAAFQALQAKGFIVVHELGMLGIDGEGKSTCYELTELKMPGTPRNEDGRKLYRQWKPGKDFPVRKCRANNPRGKNGVTVK